MAKFDFTKPLGKGDLGELKDIFRSLPSYNATGRYILPSDLHEWFKAIGYSRTNEQIETYIQHWTDFFDGKVLEDELLRIYENLHDTKLMTIELVEAADTNGDGFIQADEFTELMRIMTIHEPSLKNVSFENFIQEADTNKDGVVSLEECTAWINANIQWK